MNKLSIHLTIMMEEFNGYCLFCLEKITPYSVLSSFKVCNDTGGNCKNNPQGFLHLCNILNVKLTDELFTKLEVLPAFLNAPEEENDGGGNEISCVSFLCLECFVTVDKLDKLYKELESIQKKIEDATKLIKELINGQIDGVSIKSCGGKRKRGRRKKNYTTFEFVEAFQKLVRDSTDLSFSTGDAGIEENLGVLKRYLGTLKPVPEAVSKNKKLLSKAGRRTSLRNAQECEQSRKISDNTDEGTRDEPVHVKIEVCYAEEPLNAADDMLANGFDGCSDDDNNETIPEDDLKLFSSSKHPPFATENRVEIDSVQPLEYGKVPVKKSRKPGNPEYSATVPKKPRKTASEDFTCRECNAKFTNPARYDAHQKRHSNPSVKSLGITTVYDSSKKQKRIAYRICPICNKKLKGSQLSRFMEHTISHEMDPDNLSNPPLPCDKCDKKFLLKLNLDLHKICQHVSIQSLKCEYCESSNSRTQEELITHLKLHNAEVRIYACKSCPMACTTLDKLLSHMTRHYLSKRLFCSECDGVMVTTIKELYQHCQSAHPELKEKFDCDHCKKSFLMPDGLRKHLLNIHGIGVDEDSVGEYFCDKCTNGHVYKSKVSLKKHMINMHSKDDAKPHKCDQCDKSFRYKSLLRNHIDDKHIRTRYPCPHCPKSYVDRHSLGNHIKTHTGEGLHTCDLCGKPFPTESQLKVHSVVHLKMREDTSCVCEICGKKFSHQLHLRKHKNIHKEKKLECEYCQMKFGRWDHLRGHLRTHTGERPFVCPICTKGFNRRDILIVHMKMHGLGQEEASKVYSDYLEDLKQGNAHLKSEAKRN